MSSSSSKKKLPISWDWSTQLELNPIRDQKTSNSCFGFAICGTLDIVYRIEFPNSDPIELSPQDIYSGIIKDKEEDEAGRSVPYAVENWIYLKISYMLAIDLKKDLDFKKENDKINGKNLERRIVIAPVVAQMVWIEEMEDLKGNDIYSGPKDAEAFSPKDPNKKVEYHAIIIVGYGEEMIGKRLTKYWIIRNSHGPDWGNKGYARINRAPCHGKLLIDVAWVLGGIEVCKKQEDEKK